MSQHPFREICLLPITSGLKLWKNSEYNLTTESRSPNYLVANEAKHTVVKYSGALSFLDKMSMSVITRSIMLLLHSKTAGVE